jgi:hypothetical protein
MFRSNRTRLYRLKYRLNASHHCNIEVPAFFKGILLPLPRVSGTWLFHGRRGHRLHENLDDAMAKRQTSHRHRLGLIPPLFQHARDPRKSNSSINGLYLSCRLQAREAATLQAPERECTDVRMISWSGSMPRCYSGKHCFSLTEDIATYILESRRRHLKKCGASEDREVRRGNSSFAGCHT